MNSTSLGDLAQTFTLQRRSTELRNEMTRLSKEMTTGVVADTQKHLRGDLTQLASVEHRITVIKTAQTSNAESASFAEAAQLRIGRVLESLQDTGNAVLAYASSPLASVSTDTSQRAEDALESVIEQLNARHAGRAIFSGTATDTPPLIGKSELLDAVRPVVLGATTAVAALDAIEAWFDDPAGFSAAAYRGTNMNLQPLVAAPDMAVPFDLRADREEFRMLLRDMVALSFAGDPALAMSPGERKELAIMAAENMQRTQDALLAASAKLGVSQEAIERESTRMSNETVILQDLRNRLIGSDPYMTATELEAVQPQLETLYAITVRSSQLSLVNFLR
jgi:flagellar hook-associated protein 3 FlgL